MRKITLLLLTCICTLAVNAQVFIENFENATIGGNLEGYNNWKVSPKSTDNLGTSPKIAAGALSFSGYIGSGIGNVAVLDSVNGSSSTTQRLSTHYATFGNDTMKVATAGEKVYVAFLIKFSLDSKLNTARDFFTFETSKTSTNNRGRLFAKIKNTGKLVLTISKNSTTTTLMAETPDSLNLNDTHLIVMVYENVEGTDNDKVYAYYNPDLTKPESQQTHKISNVGTEVATDYSSTVGIGFNLRQRGIGAKIGGMRAAKTWDMAVAGISSGFNTPRKAEIKVAGKSVLTGEEGQLTIYNLSGKEIIRTFTSGNFESQLDKGLYLIKFTGNNGNTGSVKATIN